MSPTTRAACIVRIYESVAIGADSGASFYASILRNVQALEILRVARITWEAADRGEFLAMLDGARFELSIADDEELTFDMDYAGAFPRELAA